MNLWYIEIQLVILFRHISKSNTYLANFWHVFSWNRKITDHGYVDLTTDDYEILYDLIQAGLVVKEW